MTARLSSFAVASWPEVDGILQIESGIDLIEMPLDRAMNILYTLVLRNRDEKERQKMIDKLTAPMQGEYLGADDPFWGEAAQGSGFLAAMQAQEATKKGDA